MKWENEFMVHRLLDEDGRVIAALYGENTVNIEVYVYCPGYPNVDELLHLPQLHRKNLAKIKATIEEVYR